MRNGNTDLKYVGKANVIDMESERGWKLKREWKGKGKRKGKAKWKGKENK